MTVATSRPIPLSNRSAKKCDRQSLASGGPYQVRCEERHRLPPRDPRADREQTYIYRLYSDRIIPNAPSGFSIARVTKKDFIDAVLKGKAAVFKKYYRPSAAGAASRSDFFTEPEIGGNSTFIVTQPGNYIATPQVRFAKALHGFVLV